SLQGALTGRLSTGTPIAAAHGGSRSRSRRQCDRNARAQDRVQSGESLLFYCARPLFPNSIARRNGKTVIGMKVSNLCLGISLILLASSRAQMFSDKEKTIKENQNYTVRGVINIVYLPVPDAFELKEPIQSGYFLFTPQSFTVNGQDTDGKPVQFKGQ